ncbi:MAG: uridine kinase [Candidatus Xenobia bacterium]
MSNGRIPVHFNGETYQVPEGTSIVEVLGQIYVDEHGVLAATLNNHLVSLHTRLDGESYLQAVTAEHREGQEILRRTAAHMLQYLCQTHFPGVRLTVGQSLLGGYFYEVDSSEPVNLEAMASRLTTLFQELAEADVSFRHSVVSVEAVPTRVEDPYGYRKGLLRAWASAVVHLISLDGFTDLQHGPYAPTTRHAKGCRVIAYPPGLILLFPGSVITSPIPCGVDSRRLYEAYRETRDWNRLVGVTSVGDLNAASLEDRIPQVVLMAEALHEKKLAEIADTVTALEQTPRIVCVAGPSSSGKTTFVKRLAVQLQVNGLRPILVSLDDYYLDRQQTPRDEHGDFDFETIEALDRALIAEQVAALAAGQPVRLPRFDFVLGQRKNEGLEVQLRPQDVLVLEGIHALNPELLPGVNPFRIFVSALTQLVIDERNRVFTSDARLLRRLVRDRRYRGTSAAETIERWPKVRAGEERWIFPHQERADAIFNSTLVYETTVLKPFAWRYLLEVPRSHPSRVRAYELLHFLDLFVPVFPDRIPANSVLREFIGGSGFEE